MGLEGQFLKGTGPSACPIHMVGTSKVVLEVKNWPANAGDARNADLIHGSGISPGVRNDKPTLELLPGKFHGQKSLAGYSP